MTRADIRPCHEGADDGDEDGHDVETLARRLEPLVRASLGKSREPGWLVRKLRREAVLPRFCAVAHAEGTPVGFIFAGCPPSLEGRLRTAGLGVLPEARRRGHARALLAWLTGRAEAVGAPSVRCLVEPHLEGLYSQLGFSVGSRHLTAVWPGGLDDVRDPIPSIGPAPASFAPRRTAQEAGFELCQWLPEAWERTAPNRRRVVEIGELQWRARLSKEPGGWLVQRLRVPTPHLQSRRALVAGLIALRRAVPTREALFFYGVPEPIERAHGLCDPDPRAVPGLAVAQRFAVMERFTTQGRP